MYKIIIVEDEQLERAALLRIVKNNLPILSIVGEGKNGDEAVHLAQEHEPHIIIMDIKMPGKSGLEAAKEIKRLHPDIKIIILTAFDYFEYAQIALRIGTVDYLLKPVRPQELLKVLLNCINDLNNKESLLTENKYIKEQLLKLLPYIKTSLVYDLINGNIIDEEDLKQRSSITGISILPAIVMIIGIENSTNSKESNTEFQQLMKQRVYEVIRGIFGDDETVLILPIMADKFILLIQCISAFKTSDYYDYCRTRGKAIIKQLAEEDIAVSIGIGNYYENTFMIRQSYMEALAAQRCSSFAGGNEIVSGVACDQKLSSTSSSYKDQQKAELLELMYTQDWDGTIRSVDILWNNIKSNNLGEELQKAYTLELLIVLYRAAVTTESDIHTMAVLNLSMIRNIMESNTIDEIGEYFHLAIKEIMDAIKTEKTNSVTAAVNRTRNFIKNNFTKNLTLYDAAQHVNMSPCYLSRIFSREVGMTYKKYVVNAKLTYARKLLLSTNKSIGDIASEVGYQDSSYFCKIFRQDEGISPNDYRLKHKLEWTNLD